MLAITSTSIADRPIRSGIVSGVKCEVIGRLPIGGTGLNFDQKVRESAFDTEACAVCPTNISWHSRSPTILLLALGATLLSIASLHAVPASQIVVYQPRFRTGRNLGERKLVAFAPKPIFFFQSCLPYGCPDKKARLRLIESKPTNSFTGDAAMPWKYAIMLRVVPGPRTPAAACFRILRVPLVLSFCLEPVRRASTCQRS